MSSIDDDLLPVRLIVRPKFLICNPEWELTSILRSPNDLKILIFFVHSFVVVLFLSILIGLGFVSERRVVEKMLKWIRMSR